jgi:hypothetical protein
MMKIERNMYPENMLFATIFCLGDSSHRFIWIFLILLTLTQNDWPFVNSLHYTPRFNRKYRCPAKKTFTFQTAGFKVGKKLHKLYWEQLKKRLLSLVTASDKTGWVVRHTESKHPNFYIEGLEHKMYICNPLPKLSMAAACISCYCTVIFLYQFINHCQNGTDNP